MKREGAGQRLSHSSAEGGPPSLLCCRPSLLHSLRESFASCRAHFPARTRSGLLRRGCYLVYRRSPSSLWSSSTKGQHLRNVLLNFFLLRLQTSKGSAKDVMG